MRVFAISDLHVDFRDNRQWVHQVSDFDYRNDVLLIAGDVSHQLDRVEAVFDTLHEKFAHLFFVPGNHDLWAREDDTADSIDKFHRLMDVCARCDVVTQPRLMGDVWVVPLFSWYRLPELGADSLFVSKQGEDPSLRMWSDNLFTNWPIEADVVVDYFLNLNAPYLSQMKPGVPTITFSHFLPRQELIFSTASERQQVRPGARDSHPSFNFSRVAGTSLLDEQVRAFGAHVHVYGHQHRNRDRILDGVRYVSHCLGYRRERAWNLVCGLDEGPKQVWPSVS
ncbi:MAG: putative phosphodiesterase [Candidatus Latescibacterota bacterium]|jgi:predicted phosphodiesterase